MSLWRTFETGMRGLLGHRLRSVLTTLGILFGMFYPSSAWAGSQPIPIAQFTILGHGETLGDSANLGTLAGTRRVAVPGG